MNRDFKLRMPHSEQEAVLRTVSRLESASRILSERANPNGEAVFQVEFDSAPSPRPKNVPFLPNTFRREILCVDSGDPFLALLFVGSTEGAAKLAASRLQPG